MPAAAGRYELDYWGTSFAELGRGWSRGLPLTDRRWTRGRFRPGLRAARGVAGDPAAAALLPLRHDAPADLAIAIAIFFCVDPPAGSEIARVERQGVVLSRAYRTGPDAVITSFTTP